jgi:hypothetical protein
MKVHNRRFDALMAKEIFDRSYVDTVGKKTGGEGMPQSVARSSFLYAAAFKGAGKNRLDR